MTRAHEKILLEEKSSLLHNLSSLKKQLSTEQVRNEVVEKVVEFRVNKTQEKMVLELRNRTVKLEEELKNAKSSMDDMEVSHNRKTDHLKNRLEAVQTSYNSIKRRRDYEIEGFTNDILILRKQLRNLEKSILKYGSLEDKELVLLNMGTVTLIQHDSQANVLERYRLNCNLSKQKYIPQSSKFKLCLYKVGSMSLIA